MVSGTSIFNLNKECIVHTAIETASPNAHLRTLIVDGTTSVVIGGEVSTVFKRKDRYWIQPGGSADVVRVSTNDGAFGADVNVSALSNTGSWSFMYDIGGNAAATNFISQIGVEGLSGNVNITTRRWSSGNYVFPWAIPIFNITRPSGPNIKYAGGTVSGLEITANGGTNWESINGSNYMPYGFANTGSDLRIRITLSGAVGSHYFVAGMGVIGGPA